MAEKKERVFKGIAASPGIAIGTALILGDTLSTLDIKDRKINKDEIESELEKFNQALESTREEILALQEHISTTLEKAESSIFDAHLLIVDDQVLKTEVCEMINNRKAADFAFYQVIHKYIDALSAMSNPYIRERAVDIKDVGSRVMSNLTGIEKRSLKNITAQHIIIASDLTPSDTAEIDTENLQAVVIEKGSRTSHTAILARSLKMPAVVAVPNFVSRVKDDDLVIVDGFIGTMIVNPTQATQNLYAIKEEKKEKYYADLLRESTLRPETIDGFCIQLAANIEHPDDVEDANKFGAAGVGLFRTEYLFMNRKELPSEEQQFDIYREAAANLNGQPLIIRTLDVGGDKLSSIISMSCEPNPFLGLRGIRLCLANKSLIEAQLRAILRASAYGCIRMMFPMISCAEELDQVIEMTDQIKKELKAKKIPFNAEIEIGIMIETPSAALIAETLAPKLDFFSIGTNDLVQYTLAVDRCNEKVAYLYQPSHPAILGLIQKVVLAAKNNNIWVSVCGEMASDPRYTPILVGLGVHELSMGSVSLGIIRRIIRRIKMHEAEKIAMQTIKCKTAQEALDISEEFLYNVAPDIIELTTNGI